MAAVAGLRGTGSFGTDERPKNFREMILFRDPMGQSPIFGLTARAKKKTVDDPEFAWWDEPQDIVRLQVNGALGASDTVVVVDSADPSDTVPDRVYGTATHLKQGDLLLVEKADQATYDNELLEVVSVSAATTFTVKRGVGGTTAATISDDVFLTLIGSVYPEGSAAPRAVSRNPIKYYNYTQIFKDTYELSKTADKTRFRTGDPWSNDKRRKMFDHARSIEWSIMFGRKNESTGDNGHPLRFMGGLRQQIPATNITIFSSGVTPNSLLDAVYPVFNWSTPAGDERIGFVGNLGLNILNKMVLADTSSTNKIEWGGPVKVYGITFREFIMPQGRLLIKTHPLLNRHARYSKSMFILDFASINYVTLPGRDTKTTDDVQQKDEDVRRGFVQTESSLMVDRGGTTCAYLGAIQ